MSDHCLVDALATEWHYDVGVRGNTVPSERMAMRPWFDALAVDNGVTEIVASVGGAKTYVR